MRDEMRDASHTEEVVSVSNLPTSNSFGILSDLPAESLRSCDVLSLFEDDKDTPDAPCSLPKMDDPQTPQAETHADVNDYRRCTLCDLERVSEWYHLRCRDCFKIHGPP